MIIKQKNSIARAQERDRERRRKMYFDKGSPLINYIVEDAIVYFTLVLAAVAVEKDQTTSRSSWSRCRSSVVCGIRTSQCYIGVRLAGWVLSHGFPSGHDWHSSSAGASVRAAFAFLFPLRAKNPFSGSRKRRERYCFAPLISATNFVAVVIDKQRHRSPTVSPWVSNRSRLQRRTNARSKRMDSLEIVYNVCSNFCFDKSCSF